jgi:hypothetical protein
MSVHANRDITPKPPKVSSEHATKSPREALALATQEKKLTAAKLKANDNTRVRTRSVTQQNLQNLTNDMSAPKGDQQANGTQEQPDGSHSESPRSRGSHSVGDFYERSRSHSSSPHHSYDHDSQYQIEALQLAVRASEQALQLEKQAATMHDQTAF